MIGDIYPDKWGTSNELKSNIEKWYKEAGGKNKVLVAFCGQTRNETKTEQIREAIESQIKSLLKENVIETLNEQGP